MAWRSISVGSRKGYTSAQIMQIYQDCGVTSGLVNLGGNVQALGGKTDGSKWKVAIQSPDDTEDYLGILEIEDQAVITSGGYERYFEEDGVTYHHIIDPATGYPADSGLISVTIVSDDGTLADGLSTSLFIMGEEKAAQFWRENSDEFEAIMETADGKAVCDRRNRRQSDYGYGCNSDSKNKRKQKQKKERKQMDIRESHRKVQTICPGCFRCGCGGMCGRIFIWI